MTKTERIIDELRTRADSIRKQIALIEDVPDHGNTERKLLREQATATLELALQVNLAAQLRHEDR